MYLTEGTHRFWIVSLSLNPGCCVGHWRSVDLVSGVFGLLLLPHRIEEIVHIQNKAKKNKLEFQMLPGSLN